MTKQAPPKIIPAASIPGPALPMLARWIVEDSRIIADESSPFSATLIEGDPRMVLIVGENASGKSLAFRLMAQLAGQHDILPITLSIRERTGAGTMGMESMRRAMIYGNEAENSTGATSARVIESGFNNANRDKPAILALDEPEMGLSDGYAEALGEFIGANTVEASELCCGTVVVTHSRRLVSGLARGLGAMPTMIDMSSAHSSVEAWISSQETRSVEELLDLPEKASERWRAVNKILNIGRT